MITDFNEIENSALKLDKSPRAELAKCLLSSLEGEVCQAIEQAWIEEVARRKKNFIPEKSNQFQRKEFLLMPESCSKSDH